MVVRIVRFFVVAIYVLILSVVYAYDEYEKEHKYQRVSYSYSNQTELTHVDRFKPSKTGIYAVTARRDFLKNPLYSNQIAVWQKNDTLSSSLKSRVAPDINLTDYSGFEITNDAIWESFSELSNEYEPQYFSNVKEKDGKYESFDVMRGVDDERIMQHAYDLVYDAQNLISSMSIDIIDKKGNKFTQKIYDTQWVEDPEGLAYRNLLNMWENKSSESNTFMYRQTLDKIKEGIDSPQFVLVGFKIETIGSDGSRNLLKFDNVKWEKQRITGFECVVTNDQGLAREYIVEPAEDESGQFDVEIKQNAHMQIGGSDLSRENFINKLGQIINPLTILGSNCVEIGDGKVAALDVTYNDQGYIENPSDFQVLQQTSDADSWQPPEDPSVVTVEYWNSLSEEQQKILHYSRNQYQDNTGIPLHESELNMDEWEGPMDAVAHNLDGAEGNVEYRGKGDRLHQQAIYDTNHNLVISPANMGTYDFVPPNESFRKHWELDVLPWIKWGNSPDDPTTPAERIASLIKGGFWYIINKIF